MDIGTPTKATQRKGKRLRVNDRLQVRRKPHWQTPSSRIDEQQWQQLPEEMTIRIIRVQGLGRDHKRTTKYIVTTLLDPDEYPADEIASLYFHRSEIEVRFRDIKTIMGMDMLRTKSPKMIRKELMMHMIAYNAVRLLILKSAKVHQCNHRRLSFKGTLQVLKSRSSGFLNAWRKPAERERERANLLQRIAERLVPDHRGPNEPLEVKRRPKSSRWLQTPRGDHPQRFHSENYPRKILDDAA